MQELFIFLSRFYIVTGINCGNKAYEKVTFFLKLQISESLLRGQQDDSTIQSAENPSQGTSCSPRVN